MCCRQHFAAEMTGDARTPAQQWATDRVALDPVVRGALEATRTLP
jgi:hypothetical protein